MSMYLCDAPCPSNEELARRIQEGDPEAASLLLSQNEGYLTMLAASYCEQFSQDFLADDLKQEGALALLDAAQRFDASMRTTCKISVTTKVRLPVCIMKANSSIEWHPVRYRLVIRIGSICCHFTSQHGRTAL